MSWFVALPVTCFWFDVLEPPSGLVREFAVDLHLTIAFFGDVLEASAKKAFELTRAWPETPQKATVDRLELLGNPRKPSVVAGILDDPALIALLRDRRGALCDAAGVKRDKRAPLPHITFARFGRKAAKFEREAALLWATGTTLRNATVKLDAAALYRSVSRFDRKYDYSR